MNLEPINYVYIETTNHCNLKCSFCNRDEVVTTLQHAELKKFHSILEKIKDQPVKEAKLMGMGEPFMHPQFSDIAKTFKSYFPQAFLISATNCQYRLNKNFIETLQYLDMLYLSIDGYKENYERDRAPSTWKKLIEFLEDLRSVNRHNCKIVVNYVVNPRNVKDIESVNKEIVKAYELEELRLNIAQDWNPTRTMPQGYTEEQIEYLRTRWGKNIKGKSNWDFDQCFWPRRGLYLTTAGNVIMCCMNTAAKPFGNLYQQELDTIRSSLEFQKVANGCSSNNPTDHCINCSYKELSPLLKRLTLDDCI